MRDASLQFFEVANPPFLSAYGRQFASACAHPVPQSRSTCGHTPAGIGRPLINRSTVPARYAASKVSRGVPSRSNLTPKSGEKFTTIPMGRPYPGNVPPHSVNFCLTPRSASLTKPTGLTFVSNATRRSRSTPITATKNIGEGTVLSVRIIACGLNAARHSASACSAASRCMAAICCRVRSTASKMTWAGRLSAAGNP